MINKIHFLLYIRSTLKNTIITVIKTEPKTKYFQISSQSFPTKLKKKNNLYVLQQISNQLVNKLKQEKGQNIKIIFNGTGKGRYTILKHLIQKFNIIAITDTTPIPFNGCRPSKIKRR